MQIVESGFILYVVEFQACVNFYKTVIQLPVKYEKKGIVCFDFGGAYLMIEAEDRPEIESRLPGEVNRACLRMNVDSIEQARELLDDAQVAYFLGQYDWGTILKFKDPAGNLIAFRSAEEHIQDAAIWKADPKQ